ncbi:MAG: hypothetical protein R3288_02665 [Woeseiaceae bacterium]|nr:hypothetical protein [Woeseiaceae bacterium]
MAVSQPRAAESAQTVVREMSEHMRELAGRGDWSEVEDIAVRLRAAVMNVPESERRELLVEVQRVTEQVAATARDAHRDVTARLAKLRRGQVATEAYKSG